MTIIKAITLYKGKDFRIIKIKGPFLSLFTSLLIPKRISYNCIYTLH
jgi:hypothetical protein